MAEPVSAAPEIEDVVTYLEMTGRPVRPPLPIPGAKLALIRAESCTVSFYRYLYQAVGEKWIWFERRTWSDEKLAEVIRRPTTELMVLYVGGVPAGYYELDRTQPEEVELAYFGLVPEFIGRRLGPWLLEQAVISAWTGPTRRFWVHTCTFDHPKAIALYQRAGFLVYDRRTASFADPRARGILPENLTHPLLPPRP
jgi:ribosomal protein S18 acetylase RimI-like enzyme